MQIASLNYALGGDQGSTAGCNAMLVIGHADE